MIQCGQELRLALEPRDAIGIGQEQRREKLDGHVATELCVARLVDLAHPARAECGQNLVRAEPRSRREAQGIGGIVDLASASCLRDFAANKATRRQLRWSASL